MEKYEPRGSLTHKKKKIHGSPVTTRLLLGPLHQVSIPLK